MNDNETVRRGTRRFGHPWLKLGFLTAVGLIGLGACTSEEPVPIDLNGEVVTTIDPETVVESEIPAHGGSGGVDANAEVRGQAEGLAQQQCLDDPTKEQGVVQMVDPNTDEIVAEFTVDCAEFRTTQP